MPTARIRPLAEVADLLPPDSLVAQQWADNPSALAQERVLHVLGDAHLPALHLNDTLDGSHPLHAALAAGGSVGEGDTPWLILIDGCLQIDAALTADHRGAVAHLVVLGPVRARNAVLAGGLLHVQGELAVDDLLWGDANHGDLQVQGGLRARVALFTDEYHVHIAGGEQVEFLMDEVRGVPHRAEFSSEIMGAVFPDALHDGIDAGEDGLAPMLDRDRVLAAVRAGGSATRSSEEIHAWLPYADDLCPNGTISVENILAVVRSPVVVRKEHLALGWFGQTDFSICQRHVDGDGDARDDHIYITVWKTWDFYLGVQQANAPQGLLARLAGTLLRRAAPATPELTLLYRSYSPAGSAGDWQPLHTESAPQAWDACEKAWRGLLDYVRHAVAQHRAHYPLHQRLRAELTAAEIEDFTTLPVFTERYNDWWDSDRNGHWLGEVWVGARQPCMHNGEPWGRALKLSWENGETRPGDEEDDPHGSYQINVDEAREGAAAVEFTYAQRQSEARVPLPRAAAHHTARLLRFYRMVQTRLRAEHTEAEARAAEARRIEAAVRLLSAPPLAPNMPDGAVFPLELMELSAQWQADGQAYVASIRAHQLAVDARIAKAAAQVAQSERNVDGDGEAGGTDTAGDGADDPLDDGSRNDSGEMPTDPRKSAAPTVLQLARVVHAHGDDDLAQRFRQRFAFAPDAFALRASDAGRCIGPVFALEDGRVLARIGAEYEASAHWVVLQGARHTPVHGLKGLGRSVDRQVFARCEGRDVCTHQGFDGPVIARFALPHGNEGLPPYLALSEGATGQRCDELIPFNDGQRVLLRNPTGIYLLSPTGSGRPAQRLHPQTFDEDGPYTWRKNQMDEDEDEDASGHRATVLSLDMLHMALSPDEQFIAVGDQDSAHVLLDAQGTVLAEYDPVSSYPHHAVFSHDGKRLFANACHLYNGCTLSAPVPPQPLSADAEDMPLLDTHLRVYASAAQPGLVVLGGAHGYLHAICDDGQRLWRHHIGSTISAIEVSCDGSTLWAASYGGYLARLEHSEAGMDPYAIGTSPYVETGRWIFWRDEAGPLRW